MTGNPAESLFDFGNPRLEKPKEQSPRLSGAMPWDFGILTAAL
jgi:hypothetical protein